MKASKLNKLTLINKGRIMFLFIGMLALAGLILISLYLIAFKKLHYIISYILLLIVSVGLIITGFMHLIITGLIVLTIGMLIIAII